MRFRLILYVFFCLLTGCTTVPPTDAALQHIQGTWQSVAPGDTVTITFRGNSMRFYRNPDFWFDTTITLPAGTDPQQLHATIERGPTPQDSAIGQMVPAIFKIEDGILTLAAFQDNEAEPPKSFEDEEAMRYELRKIQSDR